MSGGSLGSYDYYRLNNFLDDLENAIERAELKLNGVNPDGWVISEDPRVLGYLKGTCVLLSTCVELAKAADYLAAGDTDDLSYMKEVETILGQHYMEAV